MAGMKRPSRPPSDDRQEKKGRTGCLPMAAWLGGLAALVGLNRAVSHRHTDEDKSTRSVLPAAQAAQDLPAETIEHGHEVRGLRLRPFLYVLAGLTIAGIAIQLGLWLLLESWTARDLSFDPQVPPAVVEEPDAPGPDLQYVPAAEFARYRAAEQELLNSYGDSDDDTGATRIPIERAMQILAEEGLPAREGEVPDFGLDNAYQLDSEGGQEFDSFEGGEQ